MAKTLYCAKRSYTAGHKTYFWVVELVWIVGCFLLEVSNNVSKVINPINTVYIQFVLTNYLSLELW